MHGRGYSSQSAELYSVENVLGILRDFPLQALVQSEGFPFQFSSPVKNSPELLLLTLHRSHSAGWYRQGVWAIILC